MFLGDWDPSRFVGHLSFGAEGEVSPKVKMASWPADVPCEVLDHAKTLWMLGQQEVAWVAHGHSRSRYGIGHRGSGWSRSSMSFWPLG